MILTQVIRFLLVLQLTLAPLTAAEPTLAAPKTLTEAQKIAHRLNLAGFGPRPGDVERVRGMGIARYLEQQVASRKN